MSLQSRLHDALPTKEGREISVPVLFRRVRAGGATRQGLHLLVEKGEINVYRAQF